LSLQHRFFDAFAGHLAREGMAAHNAAQHMWLPFDPSQEPMLGEGRKQSLDHLTPSITALTEVMHQQQASAEQLDLAWMANAPIGLILVPGFTHETLRHYSWHEAMDDRYSPHRITILHPDAQQGCREEPRTQGNGLRIAYLRYPRSNASSEVILPGLASLLKNSATVQSWCAEGRQLIFVGYSNGAPLSLELFAALQQGQLDAGGILEATRACVSLCGDVGGSYLADDMLAEQPRFASIDKILAFAERHPLLARTLMGLGTAQLRADLRGGAQSLGHAFRQAAIARYRDQLPDHLHYFSVGAMLPLNAYRRRWWHFNLDDWAMYRQALITDPITVYQDGQVALPDNLIPPLSHVDASQQHFLGTVRTHHWGVSYRTFNLGNNIFPRTAFYRALLEVVSETIGSR